MAYALFFTHERKGGEEVTETWSEVQYKRLAELGASTDALQQTFQNAQERNQWFQQLEQTLIRKQRAHLAAFQSSVRKPGLVSLEERLSAMLIEAGFSRVSTPIIMSRGLLKRMDIDAGHPLNDQIYWLGDGKCLRPMLAPHLYFVLKDLLRLWDKPVRIFEVGPCFRKESHGGKHSQEFTMLNLVEMGLPQEECEPRLPELAAMVMQTAGITEYAFETENSEVYGTTMDIVSGEEAVELGSGAVGPHRLDKAWKITVPWVGIGFGLERLLMIREQSSSLARMGRSLSYLNGVRLNI